MLTIKERRDPLKRKLSCNLNIYNTNKFKNITLMLNISFPISESKIPSRAILPYLFKRGFIEKDNIESIEEKLEELYGSKINFSIYKNNEFHVVSFIITIIDDNLTKEALISQALYYIKKMIYDSVIDTNFLNESMLEESKNELKNNLSNIYNNKMNYALQKFLEITYTGDNYTDFALGNVEKIDKLTISDVKNSYEELFYKAETDLFLTGKINEKHLKEYINEYFYVKTKENKLIEKRDNKIEPMVFKENLDIDQNILIIGYDTNIDTTLELITLQLVNIIVGKGMNSMLFKKIREEKQLAYYISSLIDMNNFAKRLIITSMIDPLNYNEVVELITEEINSIYQKGVTNDVLKYAKQELMNQILKAEDHPLGIIDKLLQNEKNNIPKNKTIYIDNINSIDTNTIMNYVKKIDLVTIYSLRRGENDIYKLS